MLFESVNAGASNHGTARRVLTASATMTSTDLAPPAFGSRAIQARPTGAGPPRLPLGWRLAGAVALSVAIVVGLMTIAGVHFAARQIETDLRETARVTAVAAADSIELEPEQLADDTLVPVLRDFMKAALDLYAISVFRAVDHVAVPVASTSIAAPTPATLIERVLATGQEGWSDATPHLAQVAVPIRRGDTIIGAVAVAVSLSGVERMRQTAGLIGAGGTLLAIAVLTLLIHLLASRLVLTPLDDIRRAIAAAQTGDLHARARLVRDDELGEVVLGLNAMLAALEDLHRSLSARVESATATLRERNAQLLRSYESVMQLRDAAERARQLAAIGQTAANMAHQIGTPLNLVSGHVQLLLQEIDDPALRRRLAIVQEQVERVAATVRELLHRPGSKGERRPIEIGAMLARIAEAMRIRLEASGVAVSLRVDSSLPPVLANETQLELAVLNLVTNALDAMPSGGILSLEAAATGTGVRLTVGDTGPGIDPAVAAHIFEPWITTKSSDRGAGLGLSITRDVVSDLRGTIGVSSIPGRGATFAIELPAAGASVEG
jgi:two-component system, NtrC family, sensor kinase